MEETKYDKLKLSDINDEGKTVLISQSADRPNAFNSYRESKQTAAEVKAMFDRPFLYVKNKFNALIDFIKGRDEAIEEKLAAQDGRLDGFEEADNERRQAEVLRAAAEIEREDAEARREEERAEFKDEVNDRLNEQDERLSMLTNGGGSVVLAASGWSEECEQVITLSGLGEYDLVMFYPETALDREVCGNYGVFVNPDSDGGSFKVTAKAKPLSDVSLKYYIIRGSLPEISEVE